VEAQELVFEQPAAGTLADQQSAYYRLWADSGDDVVVTLSGAAAPGATVYLTYEGVPTRTLYDLKSTLVAGTPQLRLPSAPAGTYYLLVYRDLPGAARTYQLTARQLPFGVTDVTPNHGGNVGDVTLLVSGSLLPAQPLARLISPQGEAVYGHRIYPGDGTNFFATFALSGLAVGVYDVEAAGPDGVWAAALDAFTVQAGTGANLQARLILNDLVRANAATTIIVEYENTGDIDLASPLLQIQGPDNLPFGLAPDRLDYAGAIQFLAPSYTGPAGILRPGERQRLTLHSVAAATGAAEYTLTSQSVNPLQPSTLLIDWDALREQYRPPFTADDEAWRATWRIFTQQIGATWDEVILTLADRVTGLGLSHVDSLVVDELLQEQFRQSLSRGGGLTDEAPPWIVGHTPVPAAAGGVGAVDVDFSEDLDPATFTADDVNITDPVGQAVLATAIIPLTSRTYRLEFPVQTTPGQYTVVVGPQIADLTGRELDQDHDGASGETNDDRYRASFGLGGPDATAEEYPLFVTGHTPVDPVSQTDGLTQFTVTFSQPILRYQLAPQDVILTGPDGAVPGLSVQRLSAQQYQLAFPPQNVLGDYTLTVAPAILGGPPVRVAAARTAVAGEAGNAYVGQAQVVDREAPRIVSSSPDNLQPSAVSKITVTFNEPIKPGSFGTSSVELRDPAGNLVIVTGVVRKSDTAFEITFPEQSVAGIYRLEIGEDVSSRAAEDLSGNKMSSFFGYFGIIDGLVVRGKIQYGGELLRYFGDNARVRVQLWEAKGQPDAIPGTPVTAGDTPDVLLSNRNDLATESSLWGDDLVSNLTTETGEFVFTRDDSGEYLGNTNPPRQIYLVVYAANEYAYVREENSLRINSDGSHAGDPAWVAGAQWSGRTLLWYLRHHDPTPAPVTLQAGTQRQVVDLSRTITDDQFGLSAWVRVAAKAMADKTGATSRTPIAIAFPDDNYGAGNAVHYPDPNNERIGIGTKMVTSPATVLHEYGHALEFAANNYKDFPYGVSGAGSSYGIIDESLDASGAPLLTKAFAEGWASFVAAKVLEGRQVVVAAPGQPAATGINVAGAWFDQNRSGQFLDNNDFWMGYDAFGYTVGQDRNRNGIPDYRDSDVRATNLAARFAADGINDNGNMGANVLGAVETILWHLAGRADGDGLNDLPGVWTALKAAAQGEGILYRQRLSGQARPQDFYRAYIELPGVDKAKVDKIFIDNGVPVADDIYEDNNTEATAADLGVLHGPWSQDGLIVAEAKTGDADWFRFTLPATETDPSQRRQYDTSITLDFDPKYGDLDVVVVNLTTGGRRSNLARGGGSETFRDSLWNDTQYQFLVGIGGHGVFDATGNIANPIRGGDYNPSYKLSITFALPAPAVQAAQQPQSVAVQNIAGSHDPNDKLGPTGFGAERYLSADAVWPYTVRFENDLRATAPAVLVTIRDQLDVNLDWTTFELGDIQFGEHTLSVPPGLTSYHPEPFDLRPFGNNLLVDIDARLDKATGLVQWTLTGLDPATGEMSQDPTAGFLPPNDVATHSGEGEVHYTIRSQTGLPGGTAISNLATIVFDWNEPIDTPTVVNWIDSGAPSGGVGPLPSTASELIFPVAWDATDEAGGAGVHAFDVYVSDNGGPFEPWLQDTANRTGLFVGQPNHTYAFYSQATDHAGHRESVPAVADAVTTVQLVSWQNRRSPYDVDDNGWVHPLDALRLINAINGGLRDLPQPAAPPSYWDVNDDGILTALDVLFVINVLNSGKQPAGEGEPAASGSWPTLPAASQFGGFLMPPASRNPSGPDFQSGQDGWEKRPTQGASSTPPETRPSSAAGRPAAGARRDPSPPRATVFELGDWNQPLEDALDDLFRAATQASPA
ncbi:MAG: Ig-like domain-containing protein, partial [Planctomycetota bacterium]|nr:Ig-like domain-containing protein [Planctomycetota bacterium]